MNSQTLQEKSQSDHYFRTEVVTSALSVRNRVAEIDQSPNGSRTSQRNINNCFANKKSTTVSKKKRVNIHSYGKSYWPSDLELMSARDKKGFFFIYNREIRRVKQTSLLSLEDWGDKRISIRHCR